MTKSYEITTMEAHQNANNINESRNSQRPILLSMSKSLYSELEQNSSSSK